MNTHHKVWDWRAYILHYGPDNATYKHLLLTLSCYMDSTGQSCFPSLDKLVEATSLSRPTVAKYLKLARQDGWIIVKKHGFGGQEWARNEYTATLPDSVEKAVKEVNHLDKKGSKGSKADSERQLTSHEKAVKEVNSNSPYNSSSNSPTSAGAREEPGSTGKADDPDPPSKPQQLKQASTPAELADIWFQHLKELNHWPGLSQQEIVTARIADWGVDKARKIITIAIERGYKSLRSSYLEEDSQQKQKSKRPFRPDAVHIN